MKNFCISMTSIPPRFSSLQKTLYSIQNQTIKPNKIFLNIPKKYQRFKTIDYDFKKLSDEFKNLSINRCDDFGPGTKLLGSLKNILNYDFVILLDDDHIYRKEMLEIFYEQAKKNPDNSYSFCVYDILDCKIGQGADGFLINTMFLKKVNYFFEKYVKYNKKLFLNDDLWLSIYLYKILKIDIISVFHLLKQPFLFKHKSIYTKHTTAGAIIETYSSNRKLARDLKYKENCSEYLYLKKITNNFSNI